MTAHADAAAAASPDSSQDSCPASGRWFSDPFPGSRTLVSGPQTAGLLGEGGGGAASPGSGVPITRERGSLWLLLWSLERQMGTGSGLHVLIP